MRSVSKGVWITGSIFIVFGLFLLMSPIRMLSIIFFALGGILFIVGIINAITTSKYNERYLQRYQGKAFITTCHFCNHEVICRAEDFREHRNYPEGYVYCPVCKKPLSINAFRVVNEGRGRGVPDHYEYDLDENYSDYYDD